MSLGKIAVVAVVGLVISARLSLPSRQPMGPTKKNAPPSTLQDTLNVKVDGHSMQMFVSGTGDYTVILEAGGASNHRCWRAIDKQVSKFARVISYDRPGYLESEICKKDRDAITIAKELYQALNLAGYAPPYILVGWSLGGSFARVFSGLYPEAVAGLILIDPAPEKIYPRLIHEFPEAASEDSAYMSDLMASTTRPGERAENLVFDSSINQAGRSDAFHATPTMLLISPYGKAPGKFVNDPVNILNRAWVEELEKWAATRPNLQYKIITSSGHHIAKEQPDIVLKAISDIIELVKK